MLKNWQLYLIIDPQFLEGRDIGEVVRKATEGGADVIQLRNKTAASYQLFTLAGRIREITRKTGVDFIVNDRSDIALASRADGLHLGADDLPLREARRLLGKNKIIGASTHSLSEINKAENEGADYVSFGPVYSTPLKPETPAAGVKLLKKAVALARVPLVAIGGINSDNISSVAGSGVKAVAVVRAVLDQEDITAACRRLKEKMKRCQPS